VYRTVFRSVGNPDFDQYAPLSPPEIASAKTLRVLVLKALSYIERWNLGGGNWTSPFVTRDLPTGGNEVVGNISYNGRFWRGDRS
jgi:hypothetical protein